MKGNYEQGIYAGIKWITKDGEDELSVPLIAVSASALLVVSVILSDVFVKALTCIYNPEFWALTQVLQAVGR